MKIIPALIFTLLLTQAILLGVSDESPKTSGMSVYSLEDYQGTQLAILDMGRAPTPQQVDAMRQFVIQGGELIIAGNNAYASTLVGRMEIGMRISAHAVFTAEQGTNSTLTLLGGTYLVSDARVIDGGVPVSVSDPTAWRDANGNGFPDLLEPQGAWAFASRVDLGNGSILVVASSEVTQTRDGIIALGIQDADVFVALSGTKDPLKVRSFLGGENGLFLMIAAVTLVGLTILESSQFGIIRTVYRKKKVADLDEITVQALQETQYYDEVS